MCVCFLSVTLSLSLFLSLSRLSLSLFLFLASRNRWLLMCIIFVSFVCDMGPILWAHSCDARWIPPNAIREIQGCTEWNVSGRIIVCRYYTCHTTVERPPWWIKWIMQHVCLVCILCCCVVCILCCGDPMAQISSGHVQTCLGLGLGFHGVKPWGPLISIKPEKKKKEHVNVTSEDNNHRAERIRHKTPVSEQLVHNHNAATTTAAPILLRDQLSERTPTPTTQPPPPAAIAHHGT